MKSKVIISHVVFLTVFNLMGVENVGLQFKGFDDSVIFKLNWPGKEGITNEIFDVPEFQQMTVTTESDEKYRCVIPQLNRREENLNDKYMGPNPLDLIAPLFKQSSCSHRLEAYWTYELCHGRYIRQYHEEREGKMVKLQEYFLGRWDKTQHDQLRNQLEMQKQKSDNFPVKKVAGINMAYLELNMTDGTLCDLNSKPRLTKVLYMCYFYGKHEIYSLKETSTCEYEIIVLSPLLCDHPSFRPTDTAEYTINCHPVGNSPKKPKNLLQLEAESLKLRHQHPIDDKMQNVFAVFSVDKVAGEDVSKFRLELHSFEDDEEVEEQQQQQQQHQQNQQQQQHQQNQQQQQQHQPQQQQHQPQQQQQHQPQQQQQHQPQQHQQHQPQQQQQHQQYQQQLSVAVPVTQESENTVDLSSYSFLIGSDCLQGDSGWWKYEFCYNRKVTQYHIDKDGTKHVVSLGNFIKSAHLAWLRENPKKMPEPLLKRKSVSHYYSGGTVCEKNGKQRHTEVKLKCSNRNAGLKSVSLYLLEPKVCQYILVVESKFICQLLEKVDEFGLYDPKEDIGFSKSSYKTGYQPSNSEDKIETEEKVQNSQTKDNENNQGQDMGNEGMGLDIHIPDGDD